MAECDQGSTFTVDSRAATAPNQSAVALGHLTDDISRSGCPAVQQVISIMQGQKTQLALYFVDRNGAAIDFSELSSASSKLIVKESITSSTKILNIDATVADATIGKVLVELETTSIPRAGIYHAQILLYNGDDDLLWGTNYWLAAEPSLDAVSTYDSPEPITIPEVRLVLRDVCRQDNLLLQDFEFSDTDIIACMRLPIHKFNETNQPKTNYNARTFPYHWHWLRATCGHLLEIKATGYARDALPYSAGGVSVNDKNKAKVYIELANRLLAEWENFVVSEKIQLNIARGYGSLRSSYY